MKIFHGFLLGAGLGLICGAYVFLMIVPSLGMFSGEAGWILITLSPAGAILTGVGGSITGAVAAHRARHSRPASVFIGVAAYVTALGVVGYVVWAIQQEQAFRDGLEQMKSDMWTAWTAAYGSAYPPQPASLPKLFGPLLYPGSELVAWHDRPPRHPMEFPGWTIEVACPGDLEQVLGYYMKVLPGGLKRASNSSLVHDPWTFVSETQDSADSRETIVYIRGTEDACRVEFFTRYAMTKARPDIDSGPIPPAFPQDHRQYLAEAAEYQRRWRADIANLLAPSVYPGARLVTSDFPPVTHYASQPNGVYITDDPWEVVRTRLAAQFGPEQTFTQYSRFKGVIEESFKLTVDIYPAEAHNPFDNVVLVYSATKALGSA
jgi:hypothetical protein